MTPVDEWLVSPVFEWNYFSPKRIKVNEGGSGSSKTHSILQVLILKHGIEQKGNIITIVRPTLSELKQTAMMDFFNILDHYGLYNPRFHNKSNFTYELNGNIFQFVGMDKGHKKRGAGRNVLYCNEANGLKFDDWLQLYMRTSNDIYIDYNPSDWEHFIYDLIINDPETGGPNPDVDFFRSTYLHNPFLPPARRKAIESLDAIDPDAAKVYKYGERVSLKGQIFPGFHSINIFPATNWTAYGIDFGFSNDVTAISRVGHTGLALYCEELVYQTHMLTDDIHNALIDHGVKKNDEIFADSADPRMIAELQRRGWKGIQGVKKGDESIRYGIDLMKRQPIFVKGRNAIDEFRKYRWITNPETGVSLNKPIDAFNHFIDSVRYVSLMKMGDLNRPRKRAKPRGIR